LINAISAQILVASLKTNIVPTQSFKLPFISKNYIIVCPKDNRMSYYITLNKAPINLHRGIAYIICILSYD
jgi:hypothetical protein